MNDVGDDTWSSALKPVRQLSRTDTVYDALRHAIMDGELEPGERLRAEDLAQKFKTSATPVREALARLEQGRLVRRIPYKGTFVCEIAPGDFPEIYAVLRKLEGWAIELLCILPRRWHVFATCMRPTSCMSIILLSTT